MDVFARKRVASDLRELVDKSLDAGVEPEEVLEQSPLSEVAPSVFDGPALAGVQEIDQSEMAVKPWVRPQSRVGVGTSFQRVGLGVFERPGFVTGAGVAARFARVLCVA